MQQNYSLPATITESAHPNFSHSLQDFCTGGVDAGHLILGPQPFCSAMICHCCFVEPMHFWQYSTTNLNGSALSCWRREALTEFLPLGRSRNTLSTRATTGSTNFLRSVSSVVMSTLLSLLMMLAKVP